VTVELVATPFTRATGGLRFPPSTRNRTLPVGVPAPGATGATVAVNVTLCPKTDGFPDDVMELVVYATSTACPPVSVPPLVRKLAAPL